MAAVTADKVVVELELKDGQYLAKVRTNESAFIKAQQNTARAAEDAERRIRASSQGISNALKASAASIAAGMSASAITKMADSYTSMQNRLRVTGLEARGVAEQFDELNRVADDSRSGIEGIVQTYSRLRLATEGMGFTNEQVTRTTEILAKALKASGASAQETSAALLQFGQGVGSGALQGDELRSIRENAPLVAKAIADEFNTTIGGLKKLGEEGKLTSDRVVKAVLASGQAIDGMWGNTEATVGDALTNIQNKLLRYIGETDDSIGATERMVAALNMIADNVDVIVPALTTLTVLIGARYVAAGVAAIASTVAQGIAHERAGGAAVKQALAIDGLIATQGRMLTQGEIAAANVGLQAGRMGALEAATKSLGKGLLAFAGGPIGVAVIAFTALAAAAMGASQAQKSFEDRIRESRDVMNEYNAYARDQAAQNKKVGDTASASVSGIDAMCDATDRAAAAMWGLVDAQKEAIRTNIMAQIVKNREEIQKLDKFTVGNKAGDLFRSFEVADGQFVYGVKARTAMIEALYKENANLTSNLMDFLDDVQYRPNRSGSNSATEKGKGDKNAAKKAEDRRRLLADLEQQTSLEEARLAQDVARVRELEREAEIEARIRKLKDAGFSAEKAGQVSAAVQARLDAARAKDMERIADIQQRGVDLTVAQLNENYEVIRSLERQAEYEALVEAHKESSLTLTEAQQKATADIAVIDEARANAAEKYLRQQSASHAIRIAELTGQTKLANSLKDQEEIIARTNELRQQGLYSQQQARMMAEAQVKAERSATKYGEQRDFFASTFSEGIRAAMAGDLNGFLASQFGNLADMALKKLGESLFDSAMEAPAAIAQAQAEGVAQGAAISIQVSAAMTTAGGVAATAMGAAILSSGTTVAGLIAQANAVGSAASGFNPFGGFRASGGPVRAGMSYQVGERGAETFVPSQNGYIIPNMKNATAKAGMSGMVKIVVGEGEMFTARVTEIAGPLSIQTAATSAAYSQDQMVKSQKRSGQRIF